MGKATYLMTDELTYSTKTVFFFLITKLFIKGFVSALKLGILKWGIWRLTHFWHFHDGLIFSTPEGNVWLARSCTKSADFMHPCIYTKRSDNNVLKNFRGVWVCAVKEIGTVGENGIVLKISFHSVCYKKVKWGNDKAQWSFKSLKCASLTVTVPIFHSDYSLSVSSS